MTRSGTAEALAERVLDGAINSMEMLTVVLGVQLGLYRAMGRDALDAHQLAGRAGIHPRYAREWLEQQAAAGFLAADDQPVADGADPYARRFTLPAAHHQVLVDQDSPYFLATLPGFVASFASLLPELEMAYRTGGGVPYAAYGPLTMHGIAGMNRPMFRHELAGWIAALPDVHQRLVTGPARVCDLGCGVGASSLMLAQLYPGTQVHGVDWDAASVAAATEAAHTAGLADRVTFTRQDAAAITDEGQYDLVCLFEALHDVADPVGTLRAAGQSLAPGGAVLVADERVADQFTAPGDRVERLNYAFSTLHCLPATRAEGTEVEAGTVLRAPMVRQYAEQAGLTCQVLPIENDLWRFYRLDLR